jgi:hypothetical protein
LSTESSAAKKTPFSTDYGWFFKDDLGQWKLYGHVLLPEQQNESSFHAHISMQSSDDIEQQFSVKRLKTFSTCVAAYAYAVDFEKMTQTNQETVANRPLRRRPKAGTLNPGLSPAADYSPSPINAENF